jgi:hypothetical protein
MSDRRAAALTVTKAVEGYDDWLKLRRSASGEISASPVIKCVAVVRVLWFVILNNLIYYIYNFGL